MICSPKVMFTASTLANAISYYTAVEADFNENSSYSLYLAYTGTNGGTTTTTTKSVTSPLVPNALGDAVTQVLSGTVASGIPYYGLVAWGFEVTPWIKITTWASNSDIYIDIDTNMVASAALQNGYSYSTMVCYKLATVEY